MQSSINKRRDMARSILPSRYRSPGALITKAKRSNRRSIRQELRSLTTDAGRQGDKWDELMDVRAYPDIEIRRLVFWRRGGDKLRHFERWAVAITADLPHEDRLSHMRSILPAGLIGDHAMSHLRLLPELNPAPPQYWYFGPAEAARRRATRIAAAHERRRRLVAACEAAIEDGQHRAINTALKCVTSDDVEPLLITDPNRIDEFVAGLLERGRHGAIIRLEALHRLVALLEAQSYVRGGDLDFSDHFAGDRYR